ncbi:transglycosylase [Bacillus safensis]|uniref:transglycosylase n=1 Tax=Bacillus safensis TaxID=561879 RepID=UPI002282E2B9|nr:transglycosylase [Bacillus safensis]MCY7430507.1 transglycosylase [Bacillus safensis]
MNNVSCEKCQTYYAVEVREIKEAKGIVIQFFSCPHCKNSNVVSATNKVIRQKLRELRKARSFYEQATTHRSAQRRFEKYTQLYESVKRLMLPLIDEVKQRLNNS